MHAQLIAEGKAYLSSELWTRIHSKERFNTNILRFLDEVEGWRGFSGISGCGVKKGSTAPTSDEPVRAADAEAGEGRAGEDSDDEALDAKVDRVEAALDALVA